LGKQFPLVLSPRENDHGPKNPLIQNATHGLDNPPLQLNTTSLTTYFFNPNYQGIIGIIISKNIRYKYN
jgi:hypothetical protein